MNKDIYLQFADILLSLAPDLRMSKDDIQIQLETQGLELLIAKIGNPAAELAEIVELLSLMESR